MEILFQKYFSEENEKESDLDEGNGIHFRNFDDSRFLEVERRTGAEEVEGSSSRPGQHSGS